MVVLIEVELMLVLVLVWMILVVATVMISTSKLSNRILCSIVISNNSTCVMMSNVINT